MKKEKLGRYLAAAVFVWGLDATAAPEEKLDPKQALQAAQAAGLKQALMVPYALRCPEIAAPKGDVKLLAARDKLAGLAIDFDGFMRGDMGVPEAVALLGKPVLCSRHTPGPGRYLDLHLAPSLPNLHEAYLETRDGELIGIVLGFEKPVAVDVAALEKRYGKAKKGTAPLDSFEAGSDDLAIQNSEFRAQVILSHRAHSDPPTNRQVHQVILRRTAMLSLLPEGFHSEQDVVRLLALALASRAPDPVEFAGTLGVYSQPVNGRIAYGNSLPVRNVDSAATELTNKGGLNNVRTLTVTFKEPVRCSAEGLASGLASALRLPRPAAKSVAGHMSLEVKDGAGRARGTVLLDFAGGALKSVAIERFDP